jgi:hypothetical protein
MVAMGVCDDGLINWFPWVYVKIALRAIKADVGELNHGEKGMGKCIYLKIVLNDVDVC